VLAIARVKVLGAISALLIATGISLIARIVFGA
jgi:hypothetical protein